MRLTKYNHSCVRLEKDGRVLVIDPGEWSEPEALTDAEAVLVTHEHVDHVDTELLAAAQTGNPALVVHTNADVAAQLADKEIAARTVLVGDTFEVGGFTVAVVGGEHAEIYDGLPGCVNIGFVIDGSVYHPGDAVFVPDAGVDTLLVPVSAPWLKLAEAIDFVRAVNPRRAFPIHDAMLSEIGKQGVDRWLGGKANTDYGRLSSGESVDV